MIAKICMLVKCSSHYRSTSCSSCSLRTCRKLRSNRFSESFLLCLFARSVCWEAWSVSFSCRRLSWIPLLFDLLQMLSWIESCPSYACLNYIHRWIGWHSFAWSPSPPTSFASSCHVSRLAFLLSSGSSFGLTLGLSSVLTFRLPT